MIMALLVIPTMSASVLMIFFVYDFLHILGYEINGQDIKQGIFVGFSINLVFETLFEADYALGKYKETVEEKRVMQELSVFREFDSLKNQVNPHFLFNSLNAATCRATL